MQQRQTHRGHLDRGQANRLAVGLIAGSGAVVVAVCSVGLASAATASSESLTPARSVASGAATVSPAAKSLDELTVREIIAASAQAAKAKGSVHVVGTATLRGVPVSISGDGIAKVGAAGKLVVMGRTVELYGTPSWVAVKADPALLALAGLPVTNGNGWVKFTKAQAAALLKGAFPDAGFKAKLAKLKKASKKSVGAVTKGSLTTVDGVEVLPLTLAKAGLTVYVAANGEPLPVKVVVTKRAAAEFSFSNWGTATLPSAPAASDMVDYSRR